jgi:hypothetical protein
MLLSHLRLPQPGGPVPRIYIPQEQGGPVILPGTGLLSHHLLRHAGLQWRYSYPPPREANTCWAIGHRYTAAARSAQVTFIQLLRTHLLPGGTIWTQNRSLLTAVFLSPAYTLVILPQISIEQQIATEIASLRSCIESCSSAPETFRIVAQMPVALH